MENSMYKDIEKTVLKFEFDSDKGIAILKYLLNKMGGEYNYMALLKLAFFADRFHIRNFARPVSNDLYFALKLGPVPSNLKDMLMVNLFYGENFSNTSDRYLISLNDNKIDQDQFSNSDIMAMDFAADNFGRFGIGDPFKISDLTHAYPEWDKYKEIFINKSDSSNKREKMNYLDFLLTAEPNHSEFSKIHFRDPFEPLSTEQIESITEEMTERYGVADC